MLSYVTLSSSPDFKHFQPKLLGKKDQSNVNKIFFANILVADKFRTDESIL